MSNVGGSAGQPQPQKTHQPEAVDHAVPVIPGWVRNGGFLFLGVAALMVLDAITHIGHDYGPGYGWALLACAACGTLSLWWQGYSRRVSAAELRSEQALYEQHEIKNADGMTWRRFEEYCAGLLGALRYRDILGIGSTRDDHGVDIIATAPDGVPVAVQCKRRRRTVGPNVVRELSGSIRSGKHQGRTGILMTNARATRGAHAVARDHEIVVVDRPVLQQWMSQARAQTEQRGHAPGTGASTQPRGLRPAAKVTAGILASALILLIAAALQGPATHVPAKATAPKSAPTVALVSVPANVVKEAFTAINRRDWPTLWNLWGHHGSRRGAGYREMIAGYRLTARDVVTSLKAQGNTVSARVLAYETTGTMQTYWFAYKVRAGKIVSGRSVLLATNHPQRKGGFALAQPPNLTALNSR
jgi:hypothetical protein